jgi:hypothetical protein
MFGYNPLEENLKLTFLFLILKNILFLEKLDNFSECIALKNISLENEYISRCRTHLFICHLKMMHYDLFHSSSFWKRSSEGTMNLQWQGKDVQ